MAEIIGKLDPEVLKARVSAASLQRNMKHHNSIQKEKQEKAREAQRRDLAETRRVMSGRFNSIKMKGR